MTTLVLQSVVPILVALFGVGALLVFRATAADRSDRRLAWLLSGTCFSISGINGIVTGSIAVYAYFSGLDSVALAVWNSVKPVGNDSRSFLMLGFAIMLFRVVLDSGRTSTLPARRFLSPAVIWMVIGALIGLWEGPFEYSHYAVLAIVNALTVLVLLGALWVAAVYDSMDYLLWLAITTYAIREAIGVSLFSVFNWTNVAGAWVPSYTSLQWLGIGGYCFMVVLLIRRYLLAKHSMAVPALFELGGRRMITNRDREPSHQSGAWGIE